MPYGEGREVRWRRIPLPRVFIRCPPSNDNTIDDGGYQKK
jgi:hypothetical protein